MDLTFDAIVAERLRLLGTLPSMNFSSKAEAQLCKKELALIQKELRILRSRVVQVQREIRQAGSHERSDMHSKSIRTHLPVIGTIHIGSGRSSHLHQENQRLLSFDNLKSKIDIDLHMIEQQKLTIDRWLLGHSGH